MTMRQASLCCIPHFYIIFQNHNCFKVLRHLTSISDRLSDSFTDKLLSMRSALRMKSTKFLPLYRTILYQWVLLRFAQLCYCFQRFQWWLKMHTAFSKLITKLLVKQARASNTYTEWQLSQFKALTSQLNFAEITDYWSFCGTNSKEERFLMTVLFILC
jgi:hypothetical protein